MADPVIQEQIIREAPGIEAYKLGLLQAGKTLADQKINLPAIQVAGFSAEQANALKLANAGVGSYAPYLTAANTAYNQAGEMYAGLPTYGGRAVTALTDAGKYATSEAQGAIDRAAAGTDLALRYGSGALTGIQGSAQAATQLAGQGLTSATQYGQTAQQAGFSGAQAYDPNSVYAYMNPYQQAATQATLAEIGRQGQIMQTGLAAQAVKAGAFGGSREGVQRAELQRNVLDQQARTAAQDYSTNFQQAQNASLNAFQNQQSRMQQAGNLALGAGQLQTGATGQAAQTTLQAGQNVAQTGLNVGQMAAQGAQLTGQLGMQAGQLGLQTGQAVGQANISAGQLQQAGAGGIAAIGQQKAALGQLTSGLQQGDASFLFNIGSQSQSLRQKELDAARQTTLQQAYEPFQRLSWLSDIYKGAPSSQQALTQSTTPSPSVVSQAAGLGIAGLSAYNLMKGA